MSNAVDGQGQVAVVLQRVIAAGDRHRSVLIAQVSASDHRHDAGARRCGCRIDAQDFGVGVGAAQEGHVAHAGQLDISDVFAGAGDETGILFAFDAGAYQ